MRLPNLFSRSFWFGGMSPLSTSNATVLQPTERFHLYARYLRAYQGFSVRGNLNVSQITQWKRVKFNFNKPVVNLSAGFMAGKALAWEVEGDDQATAAAKAIWNRSGSDALLLEAAKAASIYGEIVMMATQNDRKQSVIEFISPDICTPTFDGGDYSRLAALEIAYRTLDDLGRPVTRREFYDQTQWQAFVDDEEVDGRTYTAMPCVWLRNQCVKGLPFGISDLADVVDLVEEYDHLATNQTRIVDYHAAPAIVVKANKGDSDFVKGVNTVFYVGKDGDAHYLEWTGDTPEVENQLTRIRNAIGEVSQVPPVAFGQADSGLNQISGVALQILYSPLVSKTHDKRANWTPGMERVMALALQAEGYSVKMEQVNALWPDPLPVDVLGMVTEEVQKVGAGLSSKRSSMQRLGEENPEGEMKRILVEEKLSQAVNPPPPPVVPGAVGSDQPGGTAPPIPAPEPDIEAEVEALLQQFDALIQAETDNIEENEREREAAVE